MYHGTNFTSSLAHTNSYPLLWRRRRLISGCIP